MNTIDKFREQVRIARETGTFVVQTADEAQAVLEEIGRPTSQPGWITITHIEPDRLHPMWNKPVPNATASAPPHDGDDEHAH